MYYTNKPYRLDLYSFVTVTDYLLSNGKLNASSTTLLHTSIGVDTDSKTGHSVPDYKRLIARKQDASSGYSRSWYERTNVAGYSRYEHTDSGTNKREIVEIHGDMVIFDGLPSAPLPVDTALDGKAVTKFLSNIYNAQTTFNGGVFFGQLKKVVHDIRSPMSAITKGISDYVKGLKRLKPRRGKRRNLKILNDSISGAWLEAQYGWKPLLSDMDNGMKALALLTQRSPTVHVSGFAEKGDSVPLRRTTVNLDNGIAFCNYTQRNDRYTSVHYSGSIKATSDGAVSGLTIGDLGLGLKDFIPTVWQLIPYSFLVDYFLNVGEVINAYMAGTEALYYSNRAILQQSGLIASDFQVVDNIPNPNPSTTVLRTSSLCNIGKGTLTRNLYQRNQIPPSTLTPSFRYYVPGVGSLRWANMAALLAQSKSVSRFLTN